MQPPQSIQERWNNLSASMNWNLADSESVFNQLNKLYQNPERHYHNWLHIENCLSELDGLATQAPNRQAIEIALWFHDAIYDTHRKDNEQASADFAYDHLKDLDSDSQLLEEVSQLIQCTDHSKTPKNTDEQIIVDIDLAILGSPFEAYQKYAQQIRDEYRWVSESDYQQGRSKVLSNFCDREKLYFSDFMTSRYEKQARINLSEELKSLNRS